MNWKSFGAALVTLGGLALTAAPHLAQQVAPFIPGAAGPIVAAVGVFLASVTDAIHHPPGTVVKGTTPDGAVIPSGTTVAAVGAVAKTQ